MGDEIQAMVRDAEENQAADAERKLVIEAKNDADSMIYNTEKSLSEHAKDISDEVTLEIKAKITELKEALEVDEPSAETIKEKTAELQTTAQKIGEGCARSLMRRRARRTRRTSRRPS